MSEFDDDTPRPPGTGDLDKLQAAVEVWHREMFGDELDPLRLLVRQDDGRGSCLQEEADELVEAELAFQERGFDFDGWCAEEAADVALIALAYAARRGFSLLEAMERKFRVNKSRPRERVLR